MTLQLSSEQVWNELKKELFAVLGMVTPKGESRTVGVVYVVAHQKIYISTGKDSWKVRHIQSNPHVSITVPIAKRIPILPWIKIPAATITFAAQANVVEPKTVDQETLHALFHGLETDAEMLATTMVLELEPLGDFITYGVGIPLMQMSQRDKARGRASVA